MGSRQAVPVVAGVRGVAQPRMGGGGAVWRREGALVSMSRVTRVQHRSAPAAAAATCACTSGKLSVFSSQDRLNRRTCRCDGWMGGWMDGWACAERRGAAHGEAPALCAGQARIAADRPALRLARAPPRRAWALAARAPPALTWPPSHRWTCARCPSYLASAG